MQAGPHTLAQGCVAQNMIAFVNDLSCCAASSHPRSVVLQLGGLYIAGGLAPKNQAAIVESVGRAEAFADRAARTLAVRSLLTPAAPTHSLHSNPRSTLKASPQATLSCVRSLTPNP